MSSHSQVAPEHVADPVLAMMGKPKHEVYQKFTERYKKMNEACGKNQFLVPYLMSSHPGCTMKEAVELACFLRDLHYMPEQVQDFTQHRRRYRRACITPGLTRGRCSRFMWRNPHRKALQRALIQYRRPENYELVQEALRLAGRTDRIGFGEACLIRPRQLKRKGAATGKAESYVPSHSRKKAIRNVHKKK